MLKALLLFLCLSPSIQGQVLKGANVNYNASIPNYQTTYTKANTLRLQVIAEPGPNYYTDSIARSARTQQLLDTTNLTIILDLFHKPPKGFCGSKACPFSFNELIGNYLTVAQKYKNNPRVIFNVMNEPALTQKMNDDLNRRFIKEFRKAGINNIISACPAFCNPYNLRYMGYSGDSKTWVQAHVYDPFTFTHQGVYGRPTPVYYTTAVKNRLQQVLGLIRSHEVKTGRSILLGEFAASVYAPSVDRNRWYTAVYSSVKQYGWHSTYHAFAESPIWNPAGVTAIDNYLK
jgi:hypothetical protein